jgi:hypothetical protein
MTGSPIVLNEGGRMRAKILTYLATNETGRISYDTCHVPENSFQLVDRTANLLVIHDFSLTINIFQP